MRCYQAEIDRNTKFSRAIDKTCRTIPERWLINAVVGSVNHFLNHIHEQLVFLSTGNLESSVHRVTAITKQAESTSYWTSKAAPI